MLRKYHPLWISIHAAHPDELTPEMVDPEAFLDDQERLLREDTAPKLFPHLACFVV